MWKQCRSGTPEIVPNYIPQAATGLQHGQAEIDEFDIELEQNLTDRTLVRRL
jgi:hypothetical protein